MLSEAEAEAVSSSESHRVVCSERFSEQGFALEVNADVSMSGTDRPLAFSAHTIFVRCRCALFFMFRRYQVLTAEELKC